MSTFTVTKRFDFSASHVLDGLPDGHQCGRLHGHNYAVELELAADALDERGFVVDYGELAPFRRFLDENLDHRHLNDVVPGQPSAELLGAYLFGVALAELREVDGFGDRWYVAAVRVHETPKTCAEYRP